MLPYQLANPASATFEIGKPLILQVPLAELGNQDNSLIVQIPDRIFFVFRFTSAATNDSFKLAPSHYNYNQIEALDSAYINYAKF